MSNFKIIFPNDDSGISILSPALGIDVERASKDVPAGKPYFVVGVSDIPDDVFYSDAWEVDFTLDVPTFNINILKAREITKTRLRAERIPLLAAQDILFQRALETNSDTSAIVAEKNRLRNITNLVDGIDTIEELKNLHC